MPKYLGKCDCQQCGREADAYENTAGMAYYNCGPCGFRAQQRTQRGNSLFMKTVRQEGEPDDGNPPAISRELPENPAPTPAAQTQQTPAKRGGLMRNTIFGG